MAEKFKDYYDTDCAKLLASKIKTHLPQFNEEKFVQKSVGNNLNDLMKINPGAAREIINEWQHDNPGKETLWIIKHGTRSLKKKD